jgi:hypothetical protein
VLKRNPFIIPSAPVLKRQPPTGAPRPPCKSLNRTVSGPRASSSARCSGVSATSPSAQQGRRSCAPIPRASRPQMCGDADRSRCICGKKTGHQTPSPHSPPAHLARVQRRFYRRRRLGFAPKPARLRGDSQKGKPTPERRIPHCLVAALNTFSVARLHSRSSAAASYSQRERERREVRTLSPH